jgi:hypothetical protein
MDTKPRSVCRLLVFGFVLLLSAQTPIIGRAIGVSEGDTVLVNINGTEEQFRLFGMHGKQGFGRLAVNRHR